MSSIQYNMDNRKEVAEFILGDNAEYEVLGTTLIVENYHLSIGDWAVRESEGIRLYIDEMYQLL